MLPQCLKLVGQGNGASGHLIIKALFCCYVAKHFTIKEAEILYAVLFLL